jgi:hypothetical protein
MLISLQRIVSTVAITSQPLPKIFRCIINLEECTYRTFKYSRSPILGDRTPVNPIEANVLQEGIKKVNSEKLEVLSDSSMMSLAHQHIAE